MLQSEIAEEHPAAGRRTRSRHASARRRMGVVDLRPRQRRFFPIHAQANRTASIAVTALDESGQPTETKLLPVIGIWP